MFPNWILFFFKFILVFFFYLMYIFHAINLFQIYKPYQLVAKFPHIFVKGKKNQRRFRQIFSISIQAIFFGLPSIFPSKIGQNFLIIEWKCCFRIKLLEAKYNFSNYERKLLLRYHTTEYKRNFSNHEIKYNSWNVKCNFPILKWRQMRLKPYYVRASIIYY
jgi:hypothetical protein